MANLVVVKARGLHTFFNYLSEVPEGSLITADNVVIDRNGVVGQRRGFAIYGNSFGIGTDTAKQLFVYKERILRHFQSTLQFDSDDQGTFLSFAGTYGEVEPGLRIKGIEANGNFYFTTNTGIKKISAATASDFTVATGFIRNAGGVKALDVRGTVNYATPGFLSPISKVAYRIVWGYTDANKNLILGTPSTRLVMINFSTTASATVDLEFPIPSEIGTTDTQFFYQIYRTSVFTAATLIDLDDIDPGEEHRLVIEDFPTALELTTTRSVTVSDITPEDIRNGGTPLYTNPVTGEGILQANEPPPLSHDLTLFKSSVFYANTQTRQRLQIALLSVSQFVSGTSTLTISDGTTTNTYTFVGVKEITNITTVADVAGSLNNKYFYLNSSSDERMYYVWYNVNAAGVDPAIAGRLGIEVAIATGATANTVATATGAAVGAISDFNASVLTNVVTITNTNNGKTTDATDAGTTGFGISVTQQGDGEDTTLLHVLLSDAATPSQQIDETARSLVHVINSNSLEITNAFYISSEDNVPGQFLLEARDFTVGQFFITVDNATTGSEFNPTLPTTGQSIISDNEIAPNRIYFSKYQQPEAVPLVNTFDVGPRDQPIRRVLALRESMFVLKDDGVYRVTGDAGVFTVDLFDNSANISTADSAAILNNQIYMLTSQGVSTVSDTGVSIVSRPIEDKIIGVTNDNYDYQTSTFGVSYEADRSYLLFLVTTVNDDVATQCYRYNVFTNSWTRWDISKTCGIVNPSNNRMYLGAADTNFIEKERKDFRRTDFADRNFSREIGPVAVDGTTIMLSTVENIDIGDALVQTQYLTIYKFNQLLNKLDIDPTVSDTNYFSLLGAEDGDRLRTHIDNLADKLDNDPGVNDTNYAASLGGGPTFANVQADFNIIVNKLNADLGVFFSNYPLSTGTIDFEVVVISVDINTNKVIVQFSTALQEGPVEVYKSIATSTIWAPQTFGDPSIMKQVREGTIIFESNNFTLAKMAYSSDLSPDFETIDFNGTGKGDWGFFIWGNQNWGGGGSQVPFRTYVPRDKQRCRYINARFRFNVAREKISIFGVTFVGRGLSEKAYRSTD